MNEPYDDGDIQPPTDITKQVTSLARLIDRLEPGSYILMIDKRSRLEPWHATIVRSDGDVVRTIDLFR